MEDRQKGPWLSPVESGLSHPQLCSELGCQRVRKGSRGEDKGTQTGNEKDTTGKTQDKLALGGNKTALQREQAFRDAPGMSEFSQACWGIRGTSAPGDGQQGCVKTLPEEASGSGRLGKQQSKQEKAC